MSAYRCYFLGEDNRVRAAEDIDCEADVTAIGQALAMLEERPEHRGVELWQGRRRVHPPSGSAAHADASAGDLGGCARETVAFLRLAAIELRRLADRFPSAAADQRRIADQIEEQAASLAVYLPVAARPAMPATPGPEIRAAASR
jgi:hypothetical protein